MSPCIWSWWYMGQENVWQGDSFLTSQTMPMNGSKKMNIKKTFGSRSHTWKLPLDPFQSWDWFIDDILLYSIVHWVCQCHTWFSLIQKSNLCLILLKTCHWIYSLFFYGTKLLFHSWIHFVHYQKRKEKDNCKKKNH